VSTDVTESVVVLRIGGVVRTEVNVSDWPAPELSSNASYTLCKKITDGNPYDDWEGGIPGNFIQVAYADDGTAPDCGGSNRFVLPHPGIHFSTPDPTNTVVLNDLDVEVVMLNVLAANSFDPSGVDAALVVTEWNAPCAADTMVANKGTDGDVFISYKGAFYRYERRLKSLDNTVEAPSHFAASFNESMVSSCPSAVQSFLTKGKCVRQGNCAPPAFFTATVSLSDANLRAMYNISERHVHYITGLRLENHFAYSPCSPESGYSRWRKLNSTCPAPTPLDATTLASLVAALSASTDNNEFIRDINPPSGTCTTEMGGVSAIGAQVEVDGMCFEQVHPDAYSVRDFNYWAELHFGGRAAIEHWAESGSAELQFPTSHPMSRWEQYKHRLSYLGRLGDDVSFSALPTEVQTVEIATYFGAATDSARQSDSVLACGSPGEVGNKPWLGDHFEFIEATDWTLAQLGQDFPHTPRVARSLVVDNVAFNAKDQLRQRIAWALSQIFTIAMPGTQRQHVTECWLNYYDIFTRHAFGNFKDIVREVAYSPMMGEFLTHVNNRAYASSNTYPDENFAR
jgi:cullin-associated NEDD8-dissociated protein 1